MENTNVYVVFEGIRRGVYEKWSDCQFQVKNHENAKYLGYPSLALAKKAFREGLPAFYRDIEKRKFRKDVGITKVARSPAHTAGQTVAGSRANFNAVMPDPVDAALCVHVALNRETRRLWYWYAWKQSGGQTQLMPFTENHPYQGISKNLAEFDAMMYAMSYLKKKNLPYPIYTECAAARTYARQCHDKQIIEHDMLGADGKALQQDQILAKRISGYIDWLAQRPRMNTVHIWDEETMGKSPARLNCDNGEVYHPALEQVLQKFFG